MTNNWLSKVGQAFVPQQQINSLRLTGTWLDRTDPPGIARNSSSQVGFTPTFHGQPQMLIQNPDK